MSSRQQSAVIILLLCTPGLLTLNLERNHYSCVCTKAGPESWPGSVLGPDITPALGWAGLLGTPETGNVQIPTKTKGRWI